MDRLIRWSSLASLLLSPIAVVSFHRFGRPQFAIIGDHLFVNNGSLFYICTTEYIYVKRVDPIPVPLEMHHRLQ